MTTEYKQTPIGKIPNDWEVVRLGETLSLRNGQRPKILEDEGIPVFGANGVMGYTREFLVDNDFSIIVGRVGASGEIHLGKGRIWVSDNAIYSENYNKSKVHLPYLFYLLTSKKLRKFASKTTHPIITQTFLHNFLVQLPPLPEQRGIAEVLSAVDVAVQKVDEAIAKTERLKKGLMQKLLTKGIGHKEFKDTEIGKIPKEWQVFMLRDVSLDFIGGGTPSTFNPDFWNGDIAWMTSAHISGRIVATGQKYITKKGLENSATHLVPKDNLLVATRVGIGKAAINKIDIAISQDLTGIIMDKNKAIPDFLYWVLTNNEGRLKSLAQGSTIKGILREELGRLRIPLPLVPEQRKIAEILSTIDMKLELDKKRKEKLERIKKGLMNDLLTGRKRVKVAG